jgi:hypothetical protein
LTGTSRGALERQIEDGFPYLPTGCNLSLDRQATAIVLDNVRQALYLRKHELVHELQQLAEAEGDTVLRTFLDHSGVEPADLSRQSIGGWAGLRRLAGLPTPAPGPDEERLARAIWRWLHATDRERLGFCRAVASDPATVSIADRRTERLAAMLHVSLWTGGTDPPASIDEEFRRLEAHPARCQELQQIVDVLDEQADQVTRALSTVPGCDELADVPLHIHASYSRDEILAAFGLLQPGQRPSVREGVKVRRGHEHRHLLRHAPQDRGALLTDHDVPGLPDLA